MSEIQIPKYLNITNEDNMELMARYEDNYFDLAIVDPPYGIKRAGQNETFPKNPKHKRKFFENKNWDEDPPDFAYFTELYRISKNQIIWGGNYFTTHLTPSMGWIYWDKGQKLSMSDGELAYSSFETALRSIKLNRCKISQFGGSIHPTQKPVALYTWLLKNYAKENYKILDTNLGSGSIAIAVDSMNKIEKMNLTLTACELDKQYFDLSIKRIAEQTSWQSIF